jgi:hypothetical protein
LALIATLPAHHGKPPPPKLSEDGITVRQKSRALFQRHRSLTEVSRNVRHVRFDLVSGPITDIARGQLRAIRRHPDKKCEKS